MNKLTADSIRKQIDAHVEQIDKIAANIALMEERLEASRPMTGADVQIVHEMLVGGKVSLTNKQRSSLRAVLRCATETGEHFNTPDEETTTVQALKAAKRIADTCRKFSESLFPPSAIIMQITDILPDAISKINKALGEQ